jgi:hypothetical protein
MITEVYVIDTGGLPVFYYNKKEPEVDDGTSLLFAGLFTALSNFATELSNEEIKFIEMETRSYAINKTSENYLLIFGQEEYTAADIPVVKEQLASASEKLHDVLALNNVTSSYLTNTQYDSIVTDFSVYLMTEKIVKDKIHVELRSVKKKVQGMIFKAIGYKPGECNIGPYERNKRLNWSILGFFATAFLFLLILNLDLPRWSRLLLFFPLLMSFMNFYQYYFKFCVVNAVSRKYDMN